MPSHLDTLTQIADVHTDLYFGPIFRALLARPRAQFPYGPLTDAQHARCPQSSHLESCYKLIETRLLFFDDISYGYYVSRSFVPHLVSFATIHNTDVDI